jgi:hypothetical protein
MHHTCTPDRLAAIKMLEEKIGRPLYDVNANPSSVTRDEALLNLSFNQENQDLMARLTDVQETSD